MEDHRSVSIFINYRRADTQAYAILLKEKIEAAFEGVTVRVDTEDIAIGDPWPEKLQLWLEEARVLIALVGRNWLSAVDEHFNRRIDDPADWVRREIEYALSHDTKILTVLVDKGTLPPREAFRDPIDKLRGWAANRQCYEIRPNEISSDFIKLRDRLAKICGLTPLSEADANRRENILRNYPLSRAVRSGDPRVRIKGEKEVRDDCPFVGLEFFSRETARLFFGREMEILDLILHIKSGETRLILFHGYSGVGKSSLLSAGLVPRLEERYQVFYHRRNKTIGLAAGLKELRKKAGAEQQVVYIIDQVEEMFTDKNTVGERRDFAAGLLSIYQEEPKATVVLGFRSEFLAKVKEELCDLTVLEKHGAEQQIQPLSLEGIVRAVTGVADDKTLNELYHLDVENGLPERMARDLRNYQYADYVAPILQVRLKKMWETAGEAPGLYRKLTIAAYEELGEISENDLLDRQMGKLERDALPGQDALRVLNYFVIDKPSAGTIRNEELDKTFKDVEDYPRWIAALKRVDLLIENEDNTNIRLSHDLLAPIVRERYNEMSKVISGENYDLRLENFELHYKQLQQEVYQCAHAAATETLQKALKTQVRREKLEKPLQELAYFYTKTRQSDRAAALLRAGESYQVLDPDLLKGLPEKSTPNQETLRRIVKSLNPDHWPELKKRYYPAMLSVEGGTFTMGLIKEEKEEENAPEVTLDDFHLAKTQLTWWQFCLYCADNKIDMQERAPNWGVKGDHPVVNVDWYDAIEYCNWLSKLWKLDPVYQINKEQKDPNNQNDSDDKKWTVTPNWNANGYRLPTEAEWEYAARERGKKVRFGNGKDTADPKEMNFDASEKYKKPYSVVGEYRQRTTPVDEFQPNALGLHDMSGNVYEWCWDWFLDDYYQNFADKPAENPKGPEQGRLRVRRGGAWVSYPQYCRAAYRYGWHPSRRNHHVGFRLARSS